MCGCVIKSQPYFQSLEIKGLDMSPYSESDLERHQVYVANGSEEAEVASSPGHQKVLPEIPEPPGRADSSPGCESHTSQPSGLQTPARAGRGASVLRGGRLAQLRHGTPAGHQAALISSQLGAVLCPRTRNLRAAISPVSWPLNPEDS